MHSRQYSMSLWCTVMACHCILHAGKCHISQPNFIPLIHITDTHSRTHTQANTCVNRCFTARQLVQLQKKLFSEKLNLQTSTFIQGQLNLLTKQTTITTKVCNYSGIKNDISVSSTNNLSLRFLQSLGVRASKPHPLISYI